MPTSGGSIRLFRLAGIDVFLHWSWFLIAVYEIQLWRSYFTSPIWAAAVYIGLFALVTMHEFGHALACRQVGGRAERIVLWPLGGIAFVDPPPRAGAMLWSIAAGPLVNIILFPVLTYALHLAGGIDMTQILAYSVQLLANAVHIASGVDRIKIDSDLCAALFWLWQINLGLLCFNLLPVYPLDGGQILRAILWFPLGQIRSLFIAAGVGFIGGGLLALYAFSQQSIWYGILAFFLLSQAARGWRYAQLMKMEGARPQQSVTDTSLASEERPVL